MSLFAGGKKRGGKKWIMYVYVAEVFFLFANSWKMCLYLTVSRITISYSAIARERRENTKSVEKLAKTNKKSNHFELQFVMNFLDTFFGSPLKNKHLLLPAAGKKKYKHIFISALGVGPQKNFERQSSFTCFSLSFTLRFFPS